MSHAGCSLSRGSVVFYRSVYLPRGLVSIHGQPRLLLLGFALQPALKTDTECHAVIAAN